MNAKIHVLILEDRETDAEMALRELHRGGLEFESRCVATEAAFAAALREPALDVILADYALPGYDGFSALELAQKVRPEVPFIFVSGTMGEEKAIDALHRGATDYVLKQRRTRLGPAVRRALAEVAEHELRRQAEQSLQRLSTAVEQSADTVVITDTKGDIVYANPAFEKSTGYTIAEALGQNPRIFKSGKQDAEFYQKMWATLASGHVWTGHMINRRKDGIFYEEDATISPVLDAAGKIVNYVAVKRDVTEYLNVQKQLLQAQKMETIGQLAAGVAHDFNNLLQGMLGYNEIVLDSTPPDDPRRDDLLEIQKAGRRAAELTKQLLALGRKQNLDRRVTDINALIGDLSKMLGRVIGENIRIEFDLARNLDRVNVDHGQVGQILLNLAVNARDAMPRGGCISFMTSQAKFSEVDLMPYPSARAGSFVCVAVTDTGTGMTPEILAKLFSPFFTTKGPGKGTGLGLATSYGIARQHGGWMNVYSESGSGSCFKLFLPTVEHAAEPVKFAADKKTPAAELPKGAGWRILFVEDDEVIRTMIHRQLQRNGYTVSSVADATAAVHEFVTCAGNFDLVLTDVMLPDCNGLELLDDLLVRKPGLRVLVSSGYTDNEKRWPVILERKWPFIGKPYTTAELLAALHDIFAPA